MKVSARAEYGIRALIDLAQHYGKGPVQSHDIARRQGLPEPYLNQLLTTLRRAGLPAATCLPDLRSGSPWGRHSSSSREVSPPGCALKKMTPTASTRRAADSGRSGKR